MRISFLIPAFNECTTIVEVLERIDALGLERQIIVVDDGSTDGTEQWRVGRRRQLGLWLGVAAAFASALPFLVWR
jgi:glycosyltransferase involved in cell wall biosynthesis